MCGIAGILLKRGQSVPKLESHLRAMCRAMAHRGPDGEGVYISPDRASGLGNRRLAIRDLSSAGHMPMCNSDDTVCITYNGEVYDTTDLRFQLERMNYTFRSGSDTEVILHGYEAFGEDIVQQLRGMFAFAILDRCRRPGGPYQQNPSGLHDIQDTGDPRLFVARDRLGIKPFYYAETGAGLVFASELKGLLASGLVSCDLDPSALVAFLMTGSVPSPLTIYRQIRALEAGCTLTWRDGKSEIRRYWQLPEDSVEKISRQEAIEWIGTLMEDAVRSQMVSDVPLGAFLSGGLDSSALVGMMRHCTDQRIHTCSMVFEEPEYNEAQYARSVAQAVGSKHFEMAVTGEDVLTELDRIVSAMDQPTVDGVNTYFVSKVAREAGLTVAVTGLGADELFGGYSNTFRGVPWALYALEGINCVPGGARAARAAIHCLPHRRRLAKLQDALSRSVSPTSAYLVRRGLFSPSEVEALVPPEIWQQAVSGFDLVAHVDKRVAPLQRTHPSLSLHRELFPWISRSELSTYMHDTLLRDTDIMSMAHSLEVRVPFLDHRLVEAVLRLPTALKVSGKGPKPLMLEVVSKFLPTLVRDRSTKQGFVFPFDRWMRGPLRTRILESVKQLSSSKWIRPQAAVEVYSTYQAGKAHWSRAWALVALSEWATRQGHRPD